MYSKAFDHFVPATQGACNVQKIAPEPVKRRSAVRKLSKDVTDKTTEHDNMGQTQTTPEYIDIFDSEPRRLSQKHKEEWERANSVNDETVRNDETVTMRHDDSLRRGHRDEESTDYCYAYSGSMSRDGVDEVDAPEPVKFQRSVSLKDDYSQPPDRLSVSGNDCHGDYTEPYRTNMKRSGPRQPVQSAIAPDPGGIYEFAKDINAVPRPKLTTRSQSAAAGNQRHTQEAYSHLDNATNKLQQTKLADAKGGVPCYDHLWGSSSDTPVSPNSSKTDRVNSPKTSSSSADEVFTPANKVLPANYEEPWDSEEGQNKLSRLMKRAEKKDERRQSVDKYSGAKPPVPAHRNSKVSVDNCVSKSDQNVTEKQSPVINPKIKKEIPPSYEDAWDLPEKQREFEEKLEQARKSRASQGQLASDNERKPSNVSPVNRRSLQEVGRVIHEVPRSDSYGYMAALAEKVDPTIPLEDQSFYHGTIKRSDAERMLVVFKDGSYLVRKSETSKNDYSLTMKGSNGLPMHLKISKTPEGKYILGENSPPFMTIPEMIDHYTCHKLPIQNADKISLFYPIPC